MKKRILNFIAAILCITVLTNCAGIHNGITQNATSLAAANFSYTKMNVQGSADATYILGVGGLARATLVNDAKQNLLAANPLKSNQALANITIDFKTTILAGVIYRKITCTVAADIVTFH